MKKQHTWYTLTYKWTLAQGFRIPKIQITEQMRLKKKEEQSMDTLVLLRGGTNTHGMRHAQCVFSYKQILAIKCRYHAILVGIRSCLQLASESVVIDWVVSVTMATATHFLCTIHPHHGCMVVCTYTWHLCHSPNKTHRLALFLLFFASPFW